MRILTHITARLAACALTVLVPAAGVFAQAAESGAPPIPTLNRSPHPAIGFGIMFVLGVAVIAVSIMPSKRSHLD